MKKKKIHRADLKTVELFHLNNYENSINIDLNLINYCNFLPKKYSKQGRKRPLDTPKRMIKRREREGKREKER